KKIITIDPVFSDTVDVKFSFIGLTDYIIASSKVVDANNGKYEITFISKIWRDTKELYTVLEPNDILNVKIVCASLTETIEKKITIQIKPHPIYSKNGTYKQ